MDENKPAKHVALRNEKGHFIKGHSGNPTGKAARMIPDGEGGWITPTELFQRDVAEAHQILLKVIRDPKAKDRDKLMGIKLLMDRALGTPKQQISVVDDSDESSAPIDLGKLPLDVLLALRKAARLDDTDIIDIEPDEAD